MKFSKQTLGNRNTIRSYGVDGVLIGDRKITRSCLLSSDEIIEPWPIQSVAELTLEQLAAALAWQPEIILLGTGMRRQFPAAQLTAAVMARGIGIEIMDLGAACRTFNVLIGEDRRAVAGLIL